ncbi:MAG: hypothetical protein AABX13_06240 [Nanoarchaeota archaeon]
MKSKSVAQKVVADDGLDIYYWTTWRKELTQNFKILHPGSSMNHSSLESLEQGLQEQGHPTLVVDPRGFGHSQALPIAFPRLLQANFSSTSLTAFYAILNIWEVSARD